jgi:hypothetical protein
MIARGGFRLGLQHMMREIDAVKLSSLKFKFDE